MFSEEVVNAIKETNANISFLKNKKSVTENVETCNWFSSCQIWELFDELWVDMGAVEVFTAEIS